MEFPPWTQYDGDGFTTWTFTSHTFPNEGYIGSFIIFVPDLLDPPLEDPPHSGLKYAACFDGADYADQDDWMITPQLSTVEHDFYVAIRCVTYDAFWLGIDDFSVNESTEGITIEFWAKSGESQYPPDRFQVAVSTTTNDPSSFHIISEAPYVEPPYDVWTKYTYETDFKFPELEVTVKGGLGLTATVENVGNAEVTNCEVSFAMEGGLILVPSGGMANATLGTIAAGSTADAKINVFGIGKPTISIEVTSDEGATASTTYEPFVFLFFLLG